MKKQRGIRYAVLAAFLAASGMSGAARAADEVEFNGVFLAPQKLTIGSDGSVIVNAVMGNLTGPAIADIDFYSFDGKAGDVVTVDIDGGAKSVAGSIDTIIAAFGPGPVYKKERENDDRACRTLGGVDAGSTSCSDSFIDQLVLPVTGTYTVGVTTVGRLFRDGGIVVTLSTRTPPTGSYSLVISGVTPAVQQINIDVKPGNKDEPAPLNPKSKGVIPVALLSSAEFNALDVDWPSLRFGGAGDEASWSRCNKNGMDVNGDGRLDLLCHFDNEMAKFESGDLEAIVKGKTKGGKMFEGRGPLKVVPREKD